MNTEQRRSDLVFQQNIAALRAAGIQVTSPDAVFRHTKQIRSGRAFAAAARYFDYWAQHERFPQMQQSLRYRAERCRYWYQKTAAEGM